MTIPHLFCLSHFSINRSLLKPKSLPALAAGAGTVGLADIDTLGGAYEFTTACDKAKVKPAIGMQTTLEDVTLTVHVEDGEGWTRLCRVEHARLLEPMGISDYCDAISDAPLHVTIEAGTTAAAHWAAGSRNGIETALSILQRRKVAFGVARTPGHAAGRAVAGAAARRGIPVIAAPMPCFNDENEEEALSVVAPHDTRSVRFMSGAETTALYQDLPGAVENLGLLAGRIDFGLRAQTKSLIPSYRWSFDEELSLEEDVEEGFASRLRGSPEARIGEYRERLDYEVGLIKRLGFSGYFLIVADFVRQARSLGIRVGAGRGSGAGALVAYCLGITDVDPIVYGLIFERFINPDRISPPDFDIDFADERVTEIVTYMHDKYGHDRCTQIGAYGTLGLISAWDKAATHVAIPTGSNEKIKSMLRKGPLAKAKTWKDAFETSPELKGIIDESSEYRQVFRIAEKLAGIYNTKTNHPAGLVITDRPITDYVPLQARNGPNGILTTQMDMKSIEGLGLLKFDFLSLRTLTVIDHTCQTLAGFGIDVDPRTPPHDDPATYEMLNNGYVENVFQLDAKKSASPTTIKDALQKIRIDTFDDIVALIALYRPGPLDQIELYADRKKGRKPVEFLHVSLAPILRPTFGIPIYQEQIMEMARTLAGYSMAEADSLRRAIGKKIPEDLRKHEAGFIERTVGNEGLRPRMSTEQATDIWHAIMRFADYGFNKSHAVAYGFLVWTTAYLKCHHYLAYTAAAMSAEIGKNQVKLKNTAEEVIETKEKMLPISINRSTADFRVEGDGGSNNPGSGAIRHAIGALTNVGKPAAHAIVAERVAVGPFRDLADFRARMGSRASTATTRTLIEAGAFDELTPGEAPALSRAKGLAAMETRVSTGASLFDLSPDLADVGPMSAEEMLDAERRAVGFALDRHEVDTYRHLVDGRRVLGLDKVRNTVKNMKAAGLKEITTLATIADMKDDGVKVEAYLDDGRNRVKISIAGCRIPPRATKKSPTVPLLVTLGPDFVVNDWRFAAS